ncbi:cyclic pyranopterin monophosphate synthase MoaC [Petroclostridium sp. X23]|uniref:cyclic pyranopterin monophosphate synthase MoaC n=1 Tax=Petroclostridium sp. X23 TaxID=3045146 RepID=UPI0024AD65C5|nr:cyclic pyranopterin monophosphate synthase MoaC [Petroclostridium sp. X23]WHH58812.1 cyclic pyranopterin monophosphate synthase MoaC [Petroclostridium sp. X23]
MGLTHIDENGNARMVDVSQKDITLREAVAAGKVYMKPGTLASIMDGSMPKGDVFSTARIAGIMAAKRTQELIPMCHNVPLDAVKVELASNPQEGCVDITATARCAWKTGIEMEALTAVSVAALTVYDMCKAIDKEMVIGDITLIKKTGGKSGEYIKKDV